MGKSVIQRGFAGGELAPILHARADQVRYTQGLRACRNFIVRREGGVSNRPGFAYAGETKLNDAGTRLMPFVPPSGTGVVIEMGSGYFRFYRNGAPVVVSGVPAYGGATPYVPGDLVSDAGVNYYCHAATTGNAPPNASFWHPLTGSIYEIPTPYGLSTLPDWSQSGSTLTLTHTSVAPRELVYTSITRWVLSTITTGPSIATPTGLNVTSGLAGVLTYAYVVTAATPDAYEESNPSSSDSIVNCGEPAPDTPHVLTWNAVSGAAEYYVYCDPYGNGVFGFVGTAATNAFNDTGFVADFNVTPPIPRVLFASTNNYPARSAHYQQRRVFANTNVTPDGVWLSRIGFPLNFGIASPLQDDDAVTFKLAGDHLHSVRHLIGLAAGLVALTSHGEWTIHGGGGPHTPLLPSSIEAAQDTYAGVSDVRPIVVGNTVLYLQARGTIVRELQFHQPVEGLNGRDLTVFASHLFKRKTITAMDLQQVPDSVGWFVRSDGTLLGLTYVPEQDVWGWHRHDTNGSFEDVCVVPEDENDAVYVLVARTVNAATVRYIERMARRDARDGFFQSDSQFLDSMVSYSGASTTAISGLTHLNGETVYALVNGVVQGPFVVAAGAITLTSAGTIVHVGLPYTAEMETLDFDVQGSDVRDKKKRVASLTVLVEQSSRSFLAGPDTDSLREFSPQTWEGTAQSTTGALELTLTSLFNDNGRMVIQQVDPLPLTVLGIVPHLVVGG